MKEYIEREAAIDFVASIVSSMSVCVSKDEWIGMDSMKKRAVSALKDVPAADVVEVVRCKECKYSRTPNQYDKFESVACDGVLICCVGFDHVYPSSDDGLIFVDKNDYCSYGERKGGDE